MRRQEHILSGRPLIRLPLRPAKPSSYGFTVNLEPPGNLRDCKVILAEHPGISSQRSRPTTLAANAPAARAAVSEWKGTNGIVWLFDGYQYDGSTNTRFEMNDLWM